MRARKLSLVFTLRDSPSYGHEEYCINYRSFHGRNTITLTGKNNARSVLRLGRFTSGTKFVNSQINDATFWPGVRVVKVWWNWTFCWLMKTTMKKISQCFFCKIKETNVHQPTFIFLFKRETNYVNNFRSGNIITKYFYFCSRNIKTNFFAFTIKTYNYTH